MIKIVGGIIFGLAALGAYMGYGYVVDRYGDNPKLAAALLDNCDYNWRQLVKSPSSYALNKAQIYVGGPHANSDAELYLSKNEIYAHEVSEGRAEYLPMLVELKFESQNSFGTSISNSARCRYAAIGYEDGYVSHASLVALSSNMTLIRNPFIYEDENLLRWIDISDDVDDHESFFNYFKRFSAEVRTRFF
ncbi:hypothetical protein [Vreelandella alkaliphila]|uniref:Uncharacterized protein n=1 Tax=Vreelandella alkaliphila TaxID=272774 RepID=A0A7C9JSG7_9GAMM|nr:hypothetical protein [Halomonas alkaliphila]NDL70504.1 hypothetical protein [Halomonas alkaliphila]